MLRMFNRITLIFVLNEKPFRIVENFVSYLGKAQLYVVIVENFVSYVGKAQLCVVIVENFVSYLGKAQLCVVICTDFILIISCVFLGHGVAQFVEVLRYKQVAGWIPYCVNGIFR
jgi:hypothetical protein